MEVPASIMEPENNLKGGKGSGNFGHSGRLGEVGGSTASPDNYLDSPEYKNVVSLIHEVAPNASVFLAEMPLELAQIVASRINVIGKEYPEAIALLKSIEVVNLKDQTWASIYKDYNPGRDEPTYKMKFNSNWWLDTNNLINSVEDSYRSGFHPLGTIESVVDHELGHVVDSWLRDNDHDYSQTFVWSNSDRAKIGKYAEREGQKEAFAEVFAMSKANITIPEDGGIRRDFNKILAQVSDIRLKYFGDIGVIKSLKKEEHTCQNFIPQWIVDKYLGNDSSIKGGKGSGNFGHQGRQGQRGGSGESGAVREYHGTYKEAVARILKEGLKPGGPKGSGFRNFNKDFYIGDRAVSVFMSPDPGVALAYAGKGDAYLDPIVLEINIPAEDTSNIWKDDAAYNSVMYKGTIPPEWITVRTIKDFSRPESASDRWKPNFKAIGDTILYAVIFVDGEETKSIKATEQFTSFIWNPYARSFIPVGGLRRGKPVDTQGVREAIDTIREGTGKRLGILAEELQSGELTNLAEFATNFKDEIKQLYISTHVLGRGGLDEMGASEWGSLGQSLKEQYGYINSMVRDIDNGNIGVKDETGDVIIRESGIPELSDGFLDRVGMYTESSWGARGEFENVIRDRELKLGSLERSVLGNSKESCAECIELAARDWQPPGLLPDIGDRECGPGCNCSFEFENKELDDLADSFGHIQIGKEGTDPTDFQFTLYPEEDKSLKGGSGSGNFGHGGRQGLVGGSGEGTQPDTSKITPKQWNSLENWIEINKGYHKLRTDGNFNEFVKSLPQYQGTVYRGARLFDQEISQLKVGDSFTVNKISAATSEGEQMALEYALRTKPDGSIDPDYKKPVIFIMEDAKASSLTKVYEDLKDRKIPGVEWLSSSANVQEVILPIDNNPFEITKVEKVALSENQSAISPFEGYNRTKEYTRVTMRRLK